jgi:hypothetical protein
VIIGIPNQEIPEIGEWIWHDFPPRDGMAFQTLLRNGVKIVTSDGPSRSCVSARFPLLSGVKTMNMSARPTGTRDLIMMSSGLPKADTVDAFWHFRFVP